jgi:DNA-binding transcriptional LysR family regulator
MSLPDLNVLITLDGLLAEGSAARADQRLRLSSPAMSRALARSRETKWDPLLARAGRDLVPTPRGLELRERVSALIQGAAAVLQGMKQLDLRQLVKTFILRKSDGVVQNFGPQLIARLNHETPHVRINFVNQLNEHSTLLRNGSGDFETAVTGEKTSPKIRIRTLIRDRFIGNVRMGDSLSQGAIIPARYASKKTSSCPIETTTKFFWMKS